MFTRQLTPHSTNSFVLFGPRQTGKSVYVKSTLGRNDLYIDLLPQQNFLNYVFWLTHNPGKNISPRTRGRSFEQFFIGQLRAQIEYARLRYQLYFWWTNHGAEADLLICQGQQILCAIEIKSSNTISGTDLSGMKSFLESNPNTPSYVIGIDQARRLILNRTTVLSWDIFQTEELPSLSWGTTPRKWRKLSFFAGPVLQWNRGRTFIPECCCRGSSKTRLTFPTALRRQSLQPAHLPPGHRTDIFCHHNAQRCQLWVKPSCFLVYFFWKRNKCSEDNLLK